MSDPSAPDAPPTLPAPLPLPIAPWTWRTAVAAAPVVSAIRDDGTPAPGAEVFTVDGSATYDRDHDTDATTLAVTLMGVPVEHALGLTARIFRALYPGPFGYAGEARPEAPTPASEAHPWSVDRERLAAQLSEATERLAAVTAERDAAVAREASTVAASRTVYAGLSESVERADRQLADTRAALEGAIRDREAAESRVVAAEADTARAEAEVEALRVDLAARTDERDVTQADLDALRATQVQALTVARADLSHARAALKEADAARVQIAAEYEALRGEVDALRTEVETWRRRAVAAESAPPSPDARPPAGLTDEDVSRAVDAAVEPWRTRLAESERAYEGAASEAREAKAEVAVLRSRLDALGLAHVPASVGPVAPALAPRNPASEPPPPPVAAEAIVTAAPLLPATMRAPLPPVSPPVPEAPAAPAPDPWDTDDDTSVSVAPEAPVPPPAPPVSVTPVPAPEVVAAPTASPPPAPVSRLPGLPPLPALKAAPPAAPVPPAPPVVAPAPEGATPTPTPEPAPAGESPFAPGMGPGSPVPVPQAIPPGGAADLGDPAFTAAVAPIVGAERFFAGATDALIREASARGVSLDFDLLCAEVMALRAHLAPDGRPAVLTYARVPEASIRDRVAAYVAAHPTCGITLPSD